MPDTDAHVPMGTVHDLLSDHPKTVCRDFDSAVIPELVLDEASIGTLITILGDIRDGIRAYKAEAAAEAAADLEDAEAEAAR